MDLWLILTVVGIILVIVELVTGTFYLLVLAAGVFVAAILAALGMNEFVQSVVGSAVAVAGAWYVNRRHGAQSMADAGRANMLDRGESVVLESWTHEASGMARVKYRGTSWDARVNLKATSPSPGSVLYIESQEGNTLVVGESPPAP